MDFTVDLSLDEIKQRYRNKGMSSLDYEDPPPEKPPYHPNKPKMTPIYNKPTEYPKKSVMYQPPPKTESHEQVRFGLFKRHQVDPTKPKMEMRVETERPTVREIRRNHPEILSKEAMRLVNGDKHLIIGSLGCGHCSNEKQIIQGKYRAITLDTKSKKPALIYKWEDYHDSIKTSKKSLQELENQYQAKTVKKAIYLKLKGDLEHYIGINEVMLDPDTNYDQVLKNYRMFYIDDITPKEEKQATQMLINAKKKGTPLDTLYKQLRKESDGTKMINFIVGKEIEHAYGIRSFPTRINDSCELPTGKPSGKNGSSKDLLAHCKSVGFIEGFGILEYDAEQRKDTKALKHLEDLQQKHKKNVSRIPDIMEVMEDLKNVELSD